MSIGVASRPASASSTRVEASSLRRAATAQPTEPPLTIKKSTGSDERSILGRSSLSCFGNQHNQNLGEDANGPYLRAIAPRTAAWRRGEYRTASAARAGAKHERAEHRNDRRSRAARSHASHL